MEINLSKSSPIDALKINEFIKDVNVPIQTKLEHSIRGGNNNNNGFFGYFKHLFHGFSKESQTNIDHGKQNTSFFSRLFHGNGNPIDLSVKEEEKEEPIEEEKEEPIEEEKEEPIEEEKEEPREEEKEEPREGEYEDSLNDLETIKIILTTENTEIDLKESLKGTKIEYFVERSELPSRWV
jgi:hypothetical protein